MRKLREFLNSNGKKVGVIIGATLTISLATMITCNLISNRKVDIDSLQSELANKLSGDVGYNENLTPEMNKMAPLYEKLEDSQFELNNETKTISFSENIEKGVFCVSTNPNGPQEGDKWIDTNAENSYDISNLVEGTQKVYVYYMAKTSTMTNYDATTEQVTISNATELETFRTKVNDGDSFSGKIVILTADISIGATTAAIGTTTYPFAGTFDGAGYKITDFSITATSTNYMGFFGVTNGATIRNLTIEGSGINARQWIGGIVGQCKNTVIENCVNRTTKTTGILIVGGIVGMAEKTIIRNCRNYSNVTTTSSNTDYNSMTGGLVGVLRIGTINNCENNGTVTGVLPGVGGILGGGEEGSGYRTEVYNCTNSGNVSCSSSSSAGGIVGFLRSYTAEADKIENCKNTGTITTKTTAAGGIIGRIYANVKAEMKYCINEGTVTAGSQYAGGIVGYVGDNGAIVTIENCFNSANITAKTLDAGGIVGWITGQNGTQYGAKVLRCGNSGTIMSSTTNSGQRAGGVVGTCRNTWVEYCYNLGDIDSYKYASGVVGQYTNFNGYTGTALFAIKNCYSAGTIRSRTAGYDAGIAFFYGRNEDIAENNYFKGSYYDGDTTGYIYSKYISSLTNYGSSVSDFNGYSAEFTQNNYGLLTDSTDWALKWQIQPTIIRNPYDVIGPVGTTDTLDLVSYGASNEFKYQWYVANSETGTATAVSGAIYPTLDVTVQNTKKYYYCVITGKDSSGATATATTTKAIVGTDNISYSSNSESTMTENSSSANIITISNLTELKQFATNVNAGNSYVGKIVQLKNDISSAGTLTPIGTSSAPFAGTFDGMGHTISDITISNETTANTGLFGYVAGGTIKNLTLNTGTVTGGEGTGAFVGYITGRLENCKNKGVNVSGTNIVGGMAGKFGGIIRYCENSGIITSTTGADAAGMAGKLFGDASIYNCKNTGAVTTKTMSAGGILGSTNSKTLVIQYCTNEGAITSTTTYSGGILGAIADISTGSPTYTIYNCKNTGEIKGTKANAGIVGMSGKNSVLDVKYCINNGTINGGQASGGIVGWLVSGSTLLVEYCFNSASITSSSSRSGGILGLGDAKSTIRYCGNTGNVTIKTVSDNPYVGGIIGQQYAGNGNISYCYNTGDMTGYRLVAGIAVFYGTNNYVSYCYSKGLMTSTVAKQNGGICIRYPASSTAMTVSNNYFYGTFNDTVNNALYVIGSNVDNGSVMAGDSVTDFNTYSEGFTQNNYKLLPDSSDWALKWQVQPTIIRNPFNVIKPAGTTATLDVVAYGADDYFKYQWYVANSEEGDGTAVSGAESSTLDVTVQNAEKWYWCEVTGVDSTGADYTEKSERAVVGAGAYVTDINDPSISVSFNPTSCTWNGSAQTPTVIVKHDDVTLTQGTDYLVTYSNNTNVGNASVKIEGIGNYEGTRTETFAINKVKVTAPSSPSAKTYNGSSQSCGITTPSNTSVVEGSTTSATNAGTYTVTYKLNDTAHYEWSDGKTENKSVTWTINKANPSAIGLSPTSLTFTYKDSAKTVTVTRTGDGAITAESSATGVATVSVSGATITVTPKTAGTATITVKVAAGTNHTAPADKTFTVTVNKLKLTVPTQSGSLTYNGSNQSPTWSNYNSTYMAPGGTTSTASAGTHTAKFTLIDTANTCWSDSSTGEKSVTWSIGQYNLSNATIASVSSQTYTGSAIKPTPTVTVPLGGTTTLTSNDFTYSYGTNTAVGKGTVTVTGKGNYAGTKSTEFAISARAITVKAGSSSKKYDGQPLTNTSHEVTAGSLASGHKITTSISGTITNVGSVANTLNSVKITDANGTDVTSNYTVSKVNGTLTVTAADSANFEVTLGYTTTEYDGNLKTPSVEVKVGTTSLTVGTDYKVEYTNHENVGKATITITGKGNYAGSGKTAEFTITQRPITITAGSASKPYDGTALTNSSATVTSGSLVKDHTLSVTTSGSIKNIGSTANRITGYTIAGSAGNMTGNYKVTTAPGTLTITGEKNYSVNGVFYPTLAHAYAAITGEEGIIKVEAEKVTDNSELIIANTKKVTLDTNGNKIIKTVKQITNNGTFNIVGSGTIETELHHVINSYGTLLLDGANIIGTTYSEDTDVNDYTYSFVRIYEGLFKMTSGTIELTNHKMYICYAVNVTNAEVILEGGSITSKANNDTAPSTVINVSEATLKVTGARLVNESQISNSNYAADVIIAYKSNITIIDGTISSNSRYVKGISLGNSSLEVSGGKIINERVSDTIDIQAIYSYGNSNILVTDGQIKSNGYVGIGLWDSSSLVVEGGTIEGYRYAVRGNGSNYSITLGTDDGNVSEEGPVLIGNGTNAIKVDGTFNFYDGILKGKQAAYVSATTVKTPEDYGIFKSTEGDYKTATLAKGWDISETAGTDNVWAFLLDDPENEGMYILDIQGNGNIRDFNAYEDVPWANNGIAERPDYREKISKLIIEEGITGTGEATFNYLTQIKEIKLPSTLKSLGNYAFYRSSGVIGSVTIPASVTFVGTNPFMLVPIDEIIVETGNTAYKTSNGVLYSKDGRELMAYPMGKTSESYTVLEGTKEISQYAFYYAKINNIVLHGGLERIDYAAFEFSSLVEVVIPSSVNDIIRAAFNNSQSLEKVYIESAEISVGDYAFIDIAPNSVIYTTSKDIADKFVADVNYTDVNTDIYYPPAITTHPVDANVYANDQVTFTASATVGNPSAVNYQWQYRANSTADWAYVTQEQGTVNADGSFTTVQATREMNGYEFRAVVSNDAYPNEAMSLEELADSLASKPAKLTLKAPNYSVDGKGYETLAYAYDAIKGVGGTIIVEADNVDNERVSIQEGDNVVIDLNGKAITVNGLAGGSFITNNGTLELKDSVGNGKIDMSYTNPTDSMYIVWNLPTGNLTITSGTYKLNTNNYWPSVVRSEGTINMNGGTLECNNSGNTDTMWSAGIFASIGTANMSGGTIKVASPNKEISYGIINQAANGVANINITGGEIISDYAGAILADHAGLGLNNTSSLKVSENAKITGKYYGIVNKHSITPIEISGGTISVNSSIEYNVSAVYCLLGILNISGNANIIAKNTVGQSTGVLIDEGTVNMTSGIIDADTYGIFNRACAKINISGTANINSRYAGVHNDEDTTNQALITITGGTINGAVMGLSNQGAGKCVVGSNDGTISKTEPIITSNRFGYYCGSEDPTLEFYDGIFKAKESAIGGIIKLTTPDSYDVFNGTETISGDEYQTAYLKKLITADGITANLEGASYEYTGREITPEVSVNDGDTPLVLGEDYEVTYKDHINAGKATAVVAGIGDYMGSKELYFFIDQAGGILEFEPISGSVTYSSNEYTFGVEYSPNGELNAVSSVGNVEIMEGSIKVTGLSGLNAGEIVTVIVTVGETQNHREVSKEYVIRVTTLSSVELNAELPSDFDYTYDGTQKRPVPTEVTANGVKLIQGVDYTLSYGKNINAGTNAGSVTAIGIGNYEDSSGTVSFDIIPKLIEITAGSASKVYDGTPLTSSEYKITAGGLASGDALSATTKGSITLAGTASNNIETVNIYNTEGDAKLNYNVQLKEGVLEILPAPIEGSVIIEGLNRVGQTLKVETDVKLDDYDCTYKWYVNDTNKMDGGQEIPGTSGDSLVITDEMLDKYIYVEVTVSADNYADTIIEDITDSTNNGFNKVFEGLAPILKAETYEDVYTNEYIFGNANIAQRRSDISEIIIHNTMDNVPANAWDVSKEQNKSVMAWILPSTGGYDLHIGGRNKVIVSNGNYLFANYTTCTSITGLEYLDTYEVTDMSYMFADDSSLTNLEIEKLKVNFAGNMSYMFKGCSNLTSLDMSNFETIRATNMKGMFSGCSKLSSLDVSKFNTVNVTDMSGMFENCSELETIDVSSFYTNNVTNMASMFAGCGKVRELNLLNFNTSKVKSVGKMFKDCKTLVNLDLSRFDLRTLDGSAYYSEADGVKDIGQVEMFSGCSGLYSMVLGKYFASIDGTNMFTGCSGLVSIIAQSSSAMRLGASTGLNDLTDAVLYVPKASSEVSYEGASNYASVFGLDRVKPMIEVLGNDPEYVELFEKYEDAGVKIAGFDKEHEDEYKKYGYSLIIENADVNTDTTGTKKVIYKLNYFDSMIDIFEQ